jgi:hypothetical protein
MLLANSQAHLGAGVIFPSSPNVPVKTGGAGLRHRWLLLWWKG